MGSLQCLVTRVTVRRERADVKEDLAKDETVGFVQAREPMGERHLWPRSGFTCRANNTTTCMYLTGSRKSKSRVAVLWRRWTQ